MRYYMTMVEEKSYAVDQNKLKEYFPLHVVTKGMLTDFQLFSFTSMYLVCISMLVNFRVPFFKGQIMLFNVYFVIQ